MSKEAHDQGGPDFARFFPERAFVVQDYCERDPRRPCPARKRPWLPNAGRIPDFVADLRAPALERSAQEFKRRDAVGLAKTADHGNEPVSPLCKTLGSQSSKSKQLDERAVGGRLLTRFPPDQRHCTIQRPNLRSVQPTPEGARP